MDIRLNDCRLSMVLPAYDIGAPGEFSSRSRRVTSLRIGPGYHTMAVRALTTQLIN